MDASLALQYAVIALAVVVSAWVVAKKQFPGTVRKLRVALALPLLREGKPDWQRKLGQWIAPQPRGGGNDGCGSCDGCGPSSKP
ncbi:DUF6587 family protein [Pseudoxanthomonas indica]|uniref:Uncharacterized protein n=1 Tax=Pseudoxanthomonas indica TaxID=428993 RepID=A0A1T5LWI2_9GAMM|nr:DUF6587 family protein [Pseudoxanthomonas indica]GGD41156.1 hypothetical protein GCM10007235_11440 [Pseudoxanthomonas indica]SKC80337.1 hypothetical protein SAMN06296058_3272 [Pseudoxanthomonas indica]